MFDARVLSITTEVADRWGRFQHQVAKTLPAIDGLLAATVAATVAATALHYDMTLITRNVADFVDCPGLEIINPWNND